MQMQAHVAQDGYKSYLELGAGFKLGSYSRLRGSFHYKVFSLGLKFPATEKKNFVTLRNILTSHLFDRHMPSK